jgi:hypothetical protein
MYRATEPCLMTPKFMFNHSFQIYKDYFLTGPLKSVLDGVRRINNSPDIVESARPSTGALGIDWFAHEIATQKEIHLIGFDFQKLGFNYELPESYTKDYDTPTEQFTTSWHIPISRYRGDRSQIHSPHEESYVNSLIETGKVIHHKHDFDVNLEVIQKIAKTNRPAAKNFKK